MLNYVSSSPRKVHHAIVLEVKKTELFPSKKTIFGIDCAIPFTEATAKAVAAEGAKFAVRYLVPQSYAWKRLTRSEADTIVGAGMKLASVFQLGTDRPAGGEANGKADGKAAHLEAIAIGQLVGSAIFLAVDYDAQPKDYDAIEAYLRAAQAELFGYHVGVYGHYGVIEEMALRGACKFFWQTYAWSGGKKSERAHLYQYKNNTKLGGVSVDLNEAYTEDIFWKEERVKPVEENKVTAIVFGKKIEGAKLIDGVTMLPLREVSNAIGGKVSWDPDTHTARIDK
ncbi:glycoside hydrolase domain-containing protein [Cohnella sp.]|uniref:glycoside hydrolase domain-containing protein n=1 Tax=Cohnella sp. TaxID=1883426 RepID=UPI0035697713